MWKTFSWFSLTTVSLKLRKRFTELVFRRFFSFKTNEYIFLHLLQPDTKSKPGKSKLTKKIRWNFLVPKTKIFHPPYVSLYCNCISNLFMRLSKNIFCRKSKSKILQSSKLRIWTLFTQYEWQVLQCLNSDKTKDLLLWQLSHRPFPPFFHLFFLMHSQPLIILFISERKFIGKTNNDAACLTWATLD